MLRTIRIKTFTTAKKCKVNKKEKPDMEDNVTESLI